MKTRLLITCYLRKSYGMNSATCLKDKTKPFHDGQGWDEF